MLNVFSQEILKYLHLEEIVYVSYMDNNASKGLMETDGIARFRSHDV